jgi:hypothetical protein
MNEYKVISHYVIMIQAENVPLIITTAQTLENVFKALEMYADGHLNYKAEIVKVFL